MASVPPVADSHRNLLAGGLFSTADRLRPTDCCAPADEAMVRAAQLCPAFGPSGGSGHGVWAVAIMGFRIQASDEGRHAALARALGACGYGEFFAGNMRRTGSTLLTRCKHN